MNFIRVEKPRRPSQLSQCFGAGTGCGWCRPYLERLLESSQQESANASGDSKTAGLSSDQSAEMDSKMYAEARAKYISDGKGTPPAGAEPSPESGDLE